MELQKDKPNEMYGTIKTGLNRQYRGDKFHGPKDITTKTESANCSRYSSSNYKEKKRLA
jgi:hypothetical protein